MQYLEFIFLIFNIFFYYKSKSLYSTLIILFTGLYFVNIVFAQQVFGKPFSDEIFQTTNLSIMLFIFMTITFLFTTKQSFPKQKFSSSMNSSDFIASILILLMLAYKLYFFNFGYSGNNYSELLDDRSSIIEYFLLILAGIVYLRQYQKHLMTLIFFVIFLFLLEGERQRFVTFFLIIFLPVLLNNRLFRYHKLLLIILYFGLSSLAFYRAVSNPNLQSLHITTEAGVTRSSLKVIELGQKSSVFEKSKFSIGLILGNIVPTSFLPDDFLYKKEVTKKYNIPGGSYFVSYLYGIGGYLLVAIISALIAIFHNWLLKFRNQRGLFLYSIFIACIPRWFLYSPYNLTSFMVIISILIAISILINSNGTKRLNYHS